MKKMFIYHVDETVQNFYRDIAQAFGIEMYFCDDAIFDMELKEVFEHDTDILNGNLSLEASYLMSEEIGVDELVKVLNEFASEGIPYEGIKIMRTKVNQDWKIQDLFQEVFKENVVMHKANILHQLIQSCNSMQFDGSDPEAQEELKKALMLGYAILQKENFTNELLEQAINNITVKLKKVKKELN